MNKMYVLGIGPGEYEQMTIKAVRTLENADMIVGYSVYVDLIREYFADKKFYCTPMMGEIERCKAVIQYYRDGLNVAVICSGDAGVYGMSSLIYELAEPDMNIKIISGVTAACSGAAVLGSPLMHDFAVISLSDLLMPFDVICKRIECAAMSNMCICIYNPSSRKRSDYLSQMCDIIMRYQSADLICGAVKNIGRDGETYEIMTLDKLKGYQADMFTTIFVGNSFTKIINGKMVTPRGYADKYGL